MAVDFFNKLLLVLFLISSPVEVTNPNIFHKFTPRKEYSPELNHFLELLRDSKEDFRWIEKTAQDVLYAKERRHIQSKNDHMYPREDKNVFYNGRSSRASNSKYVPERPENDAFPYMYAKQYYRKKKLFDRRRKRNLPRRIKSVYHRRNEWNDKPNINFNKYHKTQSRRGTEYNGELNVDIFPRSQEGVLRKHDLPEEENVKTGRLIRVSKSCGCKSHHPKCQKSRCKSKAHDASCQPGSKCKGHNDEDILYEDYLTVPDAPDFDLDNESVEDSLDDLEMNADRESRKSKNIFKWFRHKDKFRGFEDEESSMGNSELDSKEIKTQKENSKRAKGSAACDFEKCKGNPVKCGCNSGKSVGNSKSEPDHGTLAENAIPVKIKKDRKAGSKHQCGKGSSSKTHNKSHKKESQQNKRDTEHSESSRKIGRKGKNFPGKDFFKKLKSKVNDKNKKCNIPTKTEDEDMNDNSTTNCIKRLTTGNPLFERGCTAQGCQQETSTQKIISMNERNNEQEVEEENIEGDKNDSKTKKSHKNCKDFQNHKHSSNFANIKDKLKSKLFHNKSESSTSKTITPHSDDEYLNSYNDLNKLISIISDARKDIHSLSSQNNQDLLKRNSVRKKVDELIQILANNESKEPDQLKSLTKIVQRREDSKDHVDRDSSTFPDNNNVIGNVVTKVLSAVDASSPSSIESTSENHVNTLDELREPTSAAEQRILLIENPFLSIPQQSTTNDNLDTTTNNVIKVTKLKRNLLIKADPFFGSQKEGAPHVKKILKDENEPAINTNEDKSDSNIYKNGNSITSSSSGNVKLERDNRFDPQEPFLGNDYSDNLENYYDYDVDYDQRAQRRKRDENDKFSSFKSRKLHSIQSQSRLMQKSTISKGNSETSSSFGHNNDEFYDYPDWDFLVNNKAPSRLQKRSEDDEYEEADPVIGEKVKYNLVKNSNVRFDNKYNNAQSADEYYTKNSNRNIIHGTNGNSLHKMKQREDEDDNEEIIPIKENFEFFPREQLGISSETTPSSTSVVNVNSPSNNDKITLKGNLKISPQVQDEQFLLNIQRPSTADQNFYSILQPVELLSSAVQRDVIDPSFMLSKVTLYPHMLLLATKISLNDKSLRKVNDIPDQTSLSSTESTAYFMFTPPQISDPSAKLHSRHTTKKSTKFTNLLKNKFKQHKDPVLDIIRTNDIELFHNIKRGKKAANDDGNENEKQRSKHMLTSIEIVAIPEGKEKDSPSTSKGKEKISPSTSEGTDKVSLLTSQNKEDVALSTSEVKENVSPLTSEGKENAQTSISTTSDSTVTYPKKITYPSKSTTYIYLNPQYMEANENDDYFNLDDTNLNRNSRSIHFFNSVKRPTNYKNNHAKQKSRNSKYNFFQKNHLKDEDNGDLNKDDEQGYEEDKYLRKEYNEDVPNMENHNNNVQTPIERNAFFNFLPLQDDTVLQNYEPPAGDSSSRIPFDHHEYQLIQPSGESFPFGKIVNSKQHTPSIINDFNPFDAVFKNGKYQLAPAEIDPEVTYGNDVGTFKKGTYNSNTDNKQGSNPQLNYDGEQTWKNFQPFDNMENIPQYELRSLNDQQIQFPPMLQDHFPLDLLNNIRAISIKGSKGETIPNELLNYNFPSTTPIIYIPFPSNNDFSNKKQEIKTVKTSHKGGGGIHPVEKNFKSKYYSETIPTNLDRIQDIIHPVNANKDVALTSQTISDKNVKHNSQIRDNSLEFSTMSNEELLKNIQKRLQGSTLSICLSLSSFDGSTPTSTRETIKRFESQATHIPYEQPNLDGTVLQAKELQIDLPNDYLTFNKFTPKSLISSKSTTDIVPFGTTESATTSNGKEDTLDSKSEKNVDDFDDYDAYDEIIEEGEKMLPEKSSLYSVGKLRRRRGRNGLFFRNLKYTPRTRREFYQSIGKKSIPKQLRQYPAIKRIRRATNMLPHYLRSIEEHKNGQNVYQDSQFFNSRRDKITETPYDLQVQLRKKLRRRDSDSITINEEANDDKLALAIRESIADLSNKQWAHLLKKSLPEKALGKQVYRDNAGVSVEVMVDDSILKLFQQFKEIMLKEIERDTCLQLTPDQRSYLQVITSESQTHDLHFKRESLSKSARETEPGNFMFKGNKRRRLFYDDNNKAPQNSELSKEIDYEKIKRDIKIKYKKVKRLLNEYERLDEDSKTKVEPVEKYLKGNIRTLRNLYKNVLIDDNKPEMYSSRKRHYMYDTNHITVNPYSTMPYEIIKKETHHTKFPKNEERHMHNKFSKTKTGTKREPKHTSFANNPKAEQSHSVKHSRKYDMKRGKRNLETDTTPSTTITTTTSSINTTTTNSFKKTVRDAVQNLFNKAFKKHHDEATTAGIITQSPPKDTDTPKTTLTTSNPLPITQNTAVHERTVSNEYKQLVEAIKQTNIKRQSDERLGMLFGSAIEGESRSTEDNSNLGFEVPVIYSYS